MSEDPKLPPPNYTAVPNLFLEKILPQITSLAELKVTMAIMRQTFGWHKKSDRMSIGQLVKFTGLSEQSVRNGVELGIKRGTISRQPAGQTFLYSLNVTDEQVQDLDPPKSLTPLKVRPEGVQNLGGQGVQDLDPQKKPPKEKKETSSSRATARSEEGADSSPAWWDEALNWLGGHGIAVSRAETYLAAQVRDFGAGRVGAAFAAARQRKGVFKATGYLSTLLNEAPRAGPVSDDDGWKPRDLTPELLAEIEGCTLEQAREALRG